MCGRFESFTKQQIDEVIQDIQEGKIRPVRASDSTPEQARPNSVVTAIGPHELAAKDYQWGIPHPREKKLLINSRIESANYSLWRMPFEQGRVVVPALAYFEPHEGQTYTVNGRTVKRQYRFASTDGTPLLMAGITNNERLSIVTTDALASISHIHPRMPLLLTAEEAQRWILGEWQSVSPVPSAALTAQPECGEEQLSLF